MGYHRKIQLKINEGRRGRDRKPNLVGGTRRRARDRKPNFVAFSTGIISSWVVVAWWLPYYLSNMSALST